MTKLCSIPRDLPAKSQSEEKKHHKMYEQMVAAARKKGEGLFPSYFFVSKENYALSHTSCLAELQQAKEAIKHEKKKQHRDKLIADYQEQWAQILPKFNSL